MRRSSSITYQIHTVVSKILQWVQDNDGWRTSHEHKNQLARKWQEGTETEEYNEFMHPESEPWYTICI